MFFLRSNILIKNGCHQLAKWIRGGFVGGFIFVQKKEWFYRFLIYDVKPFSNFLYQFCRRGNLR